MNFKRQLMCACKTAAIFSNRFPSVCLQCVQNIMPPPRCVFTFSLLNQIPGSISCRNILVFALTKTNLYRFKYLFPAHFRCECFFTAYAFLVKYFVELNSQQEC